MKYKFVDIGCCNYCCSCDDFGTEENHLYVEPIKEFIDVLPEGRGTFKENSAISTFNGTTQFFTPKISGPVKYYCKDDIIKINSDKNGPLFKNFKKNNFEYRLSGLKKYSNSTSLIETKVSCITLDNLFKKYNVSEIDYLKIDVEGAEDIILKQLIKLLINNRVKINHQIKFEYNFLSDKKKLDKLTDIICKNFGFVAEYISTPETWDEDMVLTKL